MAVVDPRLFPLLETLGAADLGWLAREVMEGVLIGRVADEPPEDLLKARTVVSRQKQDTQVGKPSFTSEQSGVPFSGNEQVGWAVSHVIERFQHTISMLSESMGNIDAVVGRAAPDGRAPGSERRETLIVLEDNGSTSGLRAQNLDIAVAAVESLRIALEGWADEVLGPGPGS